MPLSEDIKPEDLRPGDLLIIDCPYQAWLILSVTPTKRGKLRFMVVPVHKTNPKPENFDFRTNWIFPQTYRVLKAVKTDL